MEHKGHTIKVADDRLYIDGSDFTKEWKNTDVEDPFQCATGMIDIGMADPEPSEPGLDKRAQVYVSAPAEGRIDQFQLRFNSVFPDGCDDSIRGIRCALSRYYEVDLEKVEVVPSFEELNVDPRDSLYRVELDQITVYCLAHEL